MQHNAFSKTDYLTALSILKGRLQYDITRTSLPQIGDYYTQTFYDVKNLSLNTPQKFQAPKFDVSREVKLPNLEPANASMNRAGCPEQWLLHMKAWKNAGKELLGLDLFVKHKDQFWPDNYSLISNSRKCYKLSSDYQRSHLY